MKLTPYEHARNVSLARAVLVMLWHSTARVVPPMVARAVAVWRDPRSRQVATVVLLLVGLVMQVLMVLVAAYLVDLAISLMDLWVELARKHLELTL